MQTVPAGKGIDWPGPDPRLLDPAAYAAAPSRLRFAALYAYFSRVGARHILPAAGVVDTPTEPSCQELNGIFAGHQVTWRAISVGPCSRVGAVMFTPLLQSTPATAPASTPAAASAQASSVAADASSFVEEMRDMARAATYVGEYDWSEVYLSYCTFENAARILLKHWVGWCRLTL